MNVTDLYHYKAVITKVIDGDTYDATVDVGFNTTVAVRIRLFAVDCPETKGPTRAAGEDATRYVRELLYKQDWKVMIHSREYDNFGRILADVYLSDDQSLGTNLVAAGHAIPFPVRLGDCK